MQAQENLHTLFTDVLQEFVKDGNVNYKALCLDGGLGEYVEQLANTNPDTIAIQIHNLPFG